MDCSKCNTKSCRDVSLCNAIKFPVNEVLEEYQSLDNQLIVQSAAKLVDNGRAGTLSRLQEIIEFCKLMDYCKIGIAYCYGMEYDLQAVVKVFRENNIKVVPVSCTTGGFTQSSVNEQSEINKVSCNPIAQASQLNAEKVDLTLTMGLCLGHDILFNRYIESDVTTFVVKDRIFNHAPLNAVKS
jgi:uncharacterized metal-binding protein